MSRTNRLTRRGFRNAPRDVLQLHGKDYQVVEWDYRSQSGVVRLSDGHNVSVTAEYLEVCSSGHWSSGHD